MVRFECTDFFMIWNFVVFLLIADRGKHPSEGGGNTEEQPVFPWGQSAYLYKSACRARAWD